MPISDIKFQNVLNIPQKSAKSQHHSLYQQNSVEFCNDFTQNRSFCTQTLYVFTSVPCSAAELLFFPSAMTLTMNPMGRLGHLGCSTVPTSLKMACHYDPAWQCQVSHVRCNLSHVRYFCFF